MTDLSQLEAALQSPEAVRESLTAATFASLAARLEHAVAQGSADELKELERKLTSLLNDRWSALPAEVSGDILDSKRGAVGAAFEAGRLSFAHLFVSQASVHRAPDRFVGQVRKRAFVRYVEALRSGPKTNLELIDLVAEADATVSRKLRLLRAAGITGFRKEGRNVLNFLTPAAMAAAGGILSALPDPARATHEADQVVWRYNTLPIRNLSTPGRPAPRFRGHPTSDRVLSVGSGRGK